MGLGRVALQDHTFCDGTFVPRGTTVRINIHSPHFDESVYKDAPTRSLARFLPGSDRLPRIAGFSHIAQAPAFRSCGTSHLGIPLACLGPVGAQAQAPTFRNGALARRAIACTLRPKLGIKGVFASGTSSSEAHALGQRPWLRVRASPLSHRSSERPATPQVRRSGQRHFNAAPECF